MPRSHKPTRSFFDHSITRKIRLQHTEDGVFLGWSFLTPLDKTLFHNAIICRPESNLMKYLVHDGLRWAFIAHPQLQHFIDQGSETAGQDWTKQRINPSTVLPKNHMISVP